MQSVPFRDMEYKSPITDRSDSRRSSWKNWIGVAGYGLSHKKSYLDYPPERDPHVDCDRRDISTGLCDAAVFPVRKCHVRYL